MVVIMPHRSELLKFFGLTYAMSWVLWTLVALIPPGTPLRAAMFLPGTFAPALVALWLAPRPQELIDRVLQWRVPGQIGRASCREREGIGDGAVLRWYRKFAACTVVYET